MARSFVHSVRQNWIGILASVTVVGGVASAATGGAFVLGQVNSADQTSVLRNDGAGPALTLRVGKDQPPLRVNSGVLVRRLNAQLLGGHPARDFALAADVYSRTESDNRYAPLVGSPNYEAMGTLQLMAKSGEPPQISDDPFMVATPVIDVRVRAPADGAMTIRVWGLCVGSDAAGRLEIETNGVTHEFPVEEDAVSFCEATWSQALAFAEATTIRVRVHSTLGPLILGDWTATIVFTPSAP